MKKSRITDEQIIGLQKQARLPDAVAPMQGDPGAVPAASPGHRMAHFSIVRGSPDFGAK